MGADFSRIRFTPKDHFAGVELKQGGVVLDADFNELVAVLDRRLRAAASDILGPSTVSSTTPDAFKIAIAAGTLEIGKGRLYVDGLLAENHGAQSTDPADKLFDPLMGEVTFADPVVYGAQPYLPNPPALPTAGRHLVYLDVWQREVTHLERPDLVEVAVAVETSSRRQTVWQVRVLGEDSGNATCESPDGELEGWSDLTAPSTGRLTTGTLDSPPSEDPCELPPTGGYRGLENQTYRVEIHDPGQPGAGATFTWSRENASVGSRVASIVSGTELELETLGRDDVLRFNDEDWVEITTDAREFARQPGEMRKITVIEASRRITFSPALPADMLPASFPDSDFPRDQNMRVRRWDQAGEVLRVEPGGTTSVFQDLDAGTTGVIDVPASGTTLLLENGITVSFASTGSAGFRAGDYWVFAARTADVSVEILEHEPPRGIHHHYERLAIWDVAAGTVTDCRHPWPPAAEGHDCSCNACVTPESHASGRFTIQDAVNQVQQTGGTVCLERGQYALREPVRLIEAVSVCIRGQGTGTVLTSPGGAFVLRNCIAVAIENLAIISLGQHSAISVTTALGLALQQLAIAVLGTRDVRSSAIALAGVVGGAVIRENAILAPVAVLANDPAAPPIGDNRPNFLLTAAVAIEDNLLWCQRAAVTLAGNVLHVLHTRIAGNEVLGCSEVAITALGLGSPGSSMGINRNSLNISANGIRAGVAGLWIEDNKLVNSGVAARARTEVGIALATGMDKAGPGVCQILANQISGFPLAGILIGAPTRDLIVKLNVIENCGHGIVCADDANGGSMSIENNHLRDIGGGPLVMGIGVLRAETATIAGNTIRALGVEPVASTLAAAILTFGVLRARVTANEITEVAPPGDFVGIVAGIMLRAPFQDFEVTGNHVQRDAAPSAQPSNGAWHALIAGEAEARAAVSRLAGFTTVRVDASRTLVLGAGRAYVHFVAQPDAAEPIVGAAPDVAAAVVVAGLARGSVLGNVLLARGAVSAVQVVAAGECLFNGNRVELRGSPATAVRLTTTVAIVNANRVRGGERSIQIAGARSAAVLGNITTGPIEVPGGLQPPWDALNLVG
jgi:hypothetical protein